MPGDDRSQSTGRPRLCREGTGLLKTRIGPVTPTDDRNQDRMPTPARASAPPSPPSTSPLWKLMGVDPIALGDCAAGDQLTSSVPRLITDPLGEGHRHRYERPVRRESWGGRETSTH